MIDLGLIAAAKKAVAAKPRQFVTPAMVLAVVNQESHCMPYFVDTKPGSTYALNVMDAITHKVRDKQGHITAKISTGLTEGKIRDLITIPATVAGWQVPKEMAGQKAKFRFEYGYWKRYPNMPLDQRFRMSCSWGMPQFMGPNIIGGKTGDDADKFIQRFAADIEMQLLYCAGFFDGLLAKTHGDVDRAYRGYNSGNIDSQDAAVMARGKAVKASFQQIDDLLRKAG